MVLNHELRDEMQRQIERIRNADRVKPSTNEVETEILETTYGQAQTRGFSFEYDEPTYMPGGQDRAPRPLEYFLAGWAFCQQIMYGHNAVLTGTEIESLRMEVGGDIDPRSALDEAEGGVPAGFVDDEVNMTTYIESNESEASVRELVRQSRTECHAHAALQRQMTINSDVVLNGDPLDI